MPHSGVWSMPLPYEQVAAAIRRGEVAPVYTLAGDDGLQQREVLAALYERVPALGRQVFDGSRCVAGEVVSALRTAGLTPGRLIVVEDPRWMLAPRRGSDEGEPAGETVAPSAGGPRAAGAGRKRGGARGARAGTRAAAPPARVTELDAAAPAPPGAGPVAGAAAADGDEASLLAYLDRPAPGAILVLRSMVALDGRRRLTRKAAEKGVQLATTAPGDAAGWLRQVAAREGLTLGRAEWDLVRARLQGATCERMLTEVRKLVAYGAGEEVSAAAIAQLLPPSREERVFDLADAAITGQGQRALALGAALRAQGEPVPLLLFLLAKHLRTLVLVADACRDGARPEAVAARLQVHPFVARRALEQSRRLSAAALTAAWTAVWEAEFWFKSGQVNEAHALDHALLGLWRAAGARGGGGALSLGGQAEARG